MPDEKDAAAMRQARAALIESVRCLKPTSGFYAQLIAAGQSAPIIKTGKAAIDAAIKADIDALAALDERLGESDE